MSLEQSIQDLITASGQQTEAANQLNQTVSDKITDIDGRVEQKRAELDQFIDDSARAITRCSILAFDRTETFTKAGLGIVADDIDNTMSKWTKVMPVNVAYQNTWYPALNKLTLLKAIKIFSTAPGEYETPKFSNDHSRTKMRFLVTNSDATPEQVKEQVGLQNPTLTLVGGWNFASTTVEIDSIAVANVHSYKSLWVQFVNIGYGQEGQGDGVPQEITTYGGNSSFILDCVENYPALD